jgi:hypothetical protein
MSRWIIAVASALLGAHVLRRARKRTARLTFTADRRN